LSYFSPKKRHFAGAGEVVKKPIITNRFKTLDFGEGFYTTTNQEQAENFALKEGLLT